MIDEKELFELCKELKEKETGAYTKGYNNALRDVVATVKSNSFPKVGEWIPCSEWLPEEAGTYIISCVENGINHVTTVKWQNKFKRFDMTGRRAYWRITAWQPLPEPYRPEEDEE